MVGVHAQLAEVRARILASMETHRLTIGVHIIKLVFNIKQTIGFFIFIESIEKVV